MRGQTSSIISIVSPQWAVGRLTHGFCVWSPWNGSFHGALLSQCAFIVSSYTPDTKHQLSVSQKSLHYFCFVLLKTKPSNFPRTFVHLFFLFSVSFSSFSMVLMSASSKAPIKAFPCDGLFALKICRSNPESGHEINPMALSAHYKAFCCVMISFHVCQSCLYYPNPPTLFSWQQLRKQTSPIILLLRGEQGLFCGNCWRTNCKIGNGTGSKNGPCHATLDLVTSS